MNDKETVSKENFMYVTSSIIGNSIRHDCKITGDLAKAFLRNPPSGDLAAVYGERFPQIDTYPIDMTGLPLSIAVIPLLANILPIAWSYGATVHVKEIDFDFFESQQDLYRAFENYHPKIKLSGGLVADRVVMNRIKEPKTAPLVLYSGGVDATFSVWGNRALRPHLVTVRGSDIYFTVDDDVAWETIKARHNEIASSLGVNFFPIESSFKTWLAYWELNKISKSAGGWNWWFNQQQGPALVGLCAPLAWKLSSKRIIISSSFSYKDKAYIVCGSNPSTDESIRYFGATIQHYDFTVNRQEKLAFLVEEQLLRKIDIPLRVCWQTRTGYNCCKCEKCLRTIFGLYAENADPKCFGFDVSSADLISYIDDPKFQMGIFWIDVIKKLRDSNSAHFPQVKAALRKADSTPLLAKALQ